MLKSTAKIINKVKFYKYKNKLNLKIFMLDTLKIFLVIVTFFFDFSVILAQTANTDSNAKINFSGYCKNNELSKEKNHTLNSIKERYKIKSCDKLYEKLNKLEFISVRGKEIKDVSIFKYFPNLKRLGLDNNKIDNLSVFENFKNITYLSLQDNNINDIRPLLKMKSLKKFSLDRNPIEKQSEYCPVTTKNININEFCFSLEKFNAVFKTGKDKLQLQTEDIRKIIKNVINYPKLQMYYHAKQVTNRSPLQLYFNFDVPTKILALEKFNEEVLTVKKPNKLTLKIKIVVRGDLTLVKFVYPPEDIRGNFRMSKSKEKWTVLKAHIYE